MSDTDDDVRFVGESAAGETFDLNEYLITDQGSASGAQPNPQGCDRHELVKYR